MRISIVPGLSGLHPGDECRIVIEIDRVDEPDVWADLVRSLRGRCFLEGTA